MTTEDELRRLIGRWVEQQPDRIGKSRLEALTDRCARAEWQAERSLQRARAAEGFKHSAVDQLRMHSARREAAENEARRLRARIRFLEAVYGASGV